MPPAAIQHTPPLLNPDNLGLLGGGPSLIVHEVGPDARLAFGIDWQPRNCGPSGTWATPCPDPDTGDRKTGDRPEWDHFPPVLVWATDQCGLFEPADTLRERALQLLRLHAERHLGEHVVGELAARAALLPATIGLAEAVGELEAALADAGHRGAIHADRALLAPAAAVNLVVADGLALLTPGGNRWIFSAGYSSLDTTLYATGPVTVWRDQPVVTYAVQQEINEHQAVAEQHLAAGFECPETAFAVTFGGGS
ncbi:hypothetical protein GV791_01760 [Nocardia cyriacigeorgica]|uniref:Uncharacterized protein n=1 Tax=Nocardia cyriacigeorgica TaxID=135487 RepID=A0A6P1CJE7_9NOCA|nr:hypothetical protein [Nocardia cyriacigeorgica]MBF6288155.1 hypothetical protein [Nocardia cyriacigeorgica]NEW31286.1 hypothetical protein [Nocardia cyriacigeorgica]